MSTREQDLLAAWTFGLLSYKLDASQLSVYEQFYACTAPKFVLNCSRRWGKSYLLCLIAIEMAIRNPGSQIRFAAPTARQCSTIVLPLFREILEDCPKHLAPEWHRADGVWRFHNHGGAQLSEIHIVGCDNGGEERLRGTSADLWIVDEAGLVDQLDYLINDILMPQTLTTEGRGFIASTPPKTPAHPFADYCARALEQGAYAHRTIFDNPRLTPRMLARCQTEAGGTETTTWRREFLAQFVVDESRAVVPEFNPLVHMRERVRPKYFDAYVGMDLGFLDLTVVLFGYWDFKEAQLYIEDELALRRANTQKLATDIQAKELALWGRKAPYLRVSDVEHRTIADLSTLHGLKFIPTAKDDKETAVNAVRVAFQEGKILINPRCEVLKFHLETAIWSDTGRSYARIRSDGKYGHFDGVDALVYLWRSINYHRNPYPILDGHYPRDGYWVPPELRQERNDNTELARALQGPLAARRAARKVT